MQRAAEYEQNRAAGDERSEQAEVDRLVEEGSVLGLPASQDQRQPAERADDDERSGGRAQARREQDRRRKQKNGDEGDETAMRRQQRRACESRFDVCSRRRRPHATARAAPRHNLCSVSIM